MINNVRIYINAVDDKGVEGCKYSSQLVEVAAWDREFVKIYYATNRVLTVRKDDLLEALARCPN